MSIYLVVVLLLLPGQPGEPGPVVELSREVMSASSDAVCHAHATQRAEAERAKQADAIRRLGGTVRGVCQRVGEVS